MQLTEAALGACVARFQTVVQACFSSITREGTREARRTGVAPQTARHMLLPC